jgi:cyclase
LEKCNSNLTYRGKILRNLDFKIKHQLTKHKDMNRRNFIQNSALSLGAFTLLPNGLWAKSIADNPYKIKEVRGSVNVFTEKGGTIAFLNTKEGIVVVDSQFPEQSQHLIEELKN